MTKSVCRWVFAGAPSCVSSLSWREAGKEFMEGRQPALCVPGLFVTSPPVCALCKWAGGWEGRLHGKLLVLIQHVEQGRRGVLFNKATPPPTPLSSHTHTQTHTWTACSHPMCALVPPNKHHRGRHKDAHMNSLPLTHTHTHRNAEHLFLFCASKQTCFNMWTNPTILRPTLNPPGVIPGCIQWDNNDPQCDRPVLPPKDRLITRSSHSPWLRLWNLCKFVWEYAELRVLFRTSVFSDSPLLFPELSSTTFLQTDAGRCLRSHEETGFYQISCLFKVFKCIWAKINSLVFWEICLFTMEAQRSKFSKVSFIS